MGQLRGGGAGEEREKDDSRIQSLESNEHVHTHKQYTRQCRDERSSVCIQMWGLWGDLGDLGDSDGNTLGCGVV